MTELLLVADLPWVDDAVRAALGGTDYSLRTIEDPEAAALTWEEQAPPLVLVDLQIGSRGGMAVVRDLRAAAQRRGMKPPATVLLLDRYVDAFLARRAGADAWIRKPFGAFELRRLLDRLVESSAADPAEG